MLERTEFAAFNGGRDYTPALRWGLPFALYECRLSGRQSLVDYSLESADLKERMAQLYRHASYWACRPQGGELELPTSLPAGAFDRAISVDTLHRMGRTQREALVAEAARTLRAGGLFVVTADFAGGDRDGDLAHLESVCAAHDLKPTGAGVDADAGSGRAFSKTKAPAAARRKVCLGLLTWNTKEASVDSVLAYAKEAEMLARLGHEACVVVCDNGSTDGLAEALHELDRTLTVPHRFLFNDTNLGNCIARNQIIDAFVELGGDYLLFMDGDIEIVPFSSYAMLRYMDDKGCTLGCLGADSYTHTVDRALATPYLYAIAERDVGTTTHVAWTQYGMFRRDIFEAGVRFDERGPFAGAGWGFEDNDLAFQIRLAGFAIRHFFGIRYMHRAVRSSIRAMQKQRLDPNAAFRNRRQYLVEKWSGTRGIEEPLAYVGSIDMQF